MAETDKPEITTVSQLFKEFGGPKGIARAIERGNSTASEMKRRSSIPVEHWPAILGSERGQQLGLTADDLMRLHAPAKSERAA